MKHASASALGEITPLLEQLRSFEGLVEKRPGVFYRKSKAFLHFHEDPMGMFVDVRLKPEDPFTRLRTTTRREQTTLVSAVKRALAPR
jgi:hypothetical protein